MFQHQLCFSVSVFFPFWRDVSVSKYLAVKKCPQLIPVSLSFSLLSDPVWSSCGLHSQSYALHIARNKPARLVARVDACQNIALQRHPLNCISAKIPNEKICFVCLK